MPIASVQAYVQTLLNGLAMPGNVQNLAAYITPPDPNVESDVPTVYIWPDAGDESRNPAKGGTVPRATYEGAPSGFKPIEHDLNLYMVWFGADDDPDADTSFPGMVDAVMQQMRVSTDPVVVSDPWTGTQTTLIDVGENMTYHITVRALVDQRYNRYDCLLTAHILELIAS